MGASFVTGASGFVGRHLIAALGDTPIVAPSREDLDLLDAEAVVAAVAEAAPTTIFHLAARASVRRSWQEPAEMIHDNIGMTLNVLEAVRRGAREATIVVASSGEIYGPPKQLPVDEEAALRPQNPYAMSKAACDLLARQYSDAYDLDIVCLRAFNQAGPGQSGDYVVGTIAEQIAAAERRGDSEAVVETGNPDSRRDFIDVRDSARAYVAAADASRGAYNVCSGEAVSVRELVELAARAARIPVRHVVRPNRVRSHDVPEVRGSAARLERETGWRPSIPLARTVADAIDALRPRESVAS